MVIPYQLYMLQRISDYFNQCDSEQQTAVNDFYSGIDLQSLINLKAKRRVERPGLIEVWGLETA